MALEPCDCDDLLLETVVRNICAEDVGQVQKIGVQIQQASDEPPFATLADLKDLANWQDLLDANDETKIVITPLIDGMVIPPTTPILEGGSGSNETVDGLPIAHDGQAVRVEGMMRSITAAIRRALKKIRCVQTQDRPVVIFLFNDKKKVVCQRAADGVGFEGIPAYSTFVGDPGTEGLNHNDKTPISFSLASGWADDREIVAPDFNFRTELFPTAS